MATCPCCRTPCMRHPHICSPCHHVFCGKCLRQVITSPAHNNRCVICNHNIRTFKPYLGQESPDELNTRVYDPQLDDNNNKNSRRILSSDCAVDRPQPHRTGHTTTAAKSAAQRLSNLSWDSLWSEVSRSSPNIKRIKSPIQQICRRSGGTEATTQLRRRNNIAALLSPPVAQLRYCSKKSTSPPSYATQKQNTSAMESSANNVRSNKRKYKERSVSPGPPMLYRDRSVSPRSPTKSKDRGLSPGPPVKSRDHKLSPGPSTKSRDRSLSSGPPTKSRNRSLSPGPPTKSRDRSLSPGPPAKSRDRSLSPGPPTKSRDRSLSPGPHSTIRQVNCRQGFNCQTISPHNNTLPMATSYHVSTHDNQTEGMAGQSEDTVAQHQSCNGASCGNDITSNAYNTGNTTDVRHRHTSTAVSDNRSFLLTATNNLDSENRNTDHENTESNGGRDVTPRHKTSTSSLNLASVSYSDMLPLPVTALSSDDVVLASAQRSSSDTTRTLHHRNRLSELRMSAGQSGQLLMSMLMDQHAGDSVRQAPRLRTARRRRGVLTPLTLLLHIIAILLLLFSGAILGFVGGVLAGQTGLVLGHYLGTFIAGFLAVFKYLRAWTRESVAACVLQWVWCGLVTGLVSTCLEVCPFEDAFMGGMLGAFAGHYVGEFVSMA